MQTWGLSEEDMGLFWGEPGPANLTGSQVGCVWLPSRGQGPGFLPS